MNKKNVAVPRRPVDRKQERRMPKERGSRTLKSRRTKSSTATGEKATYLLSGTLTLPPVTAFAEHIYEPRNKPLNSQLTKISLPLAAFSANILLYSGSYQVTSGIAEV